MPHKRLETILRRSLVRNGLDKGATLVVAASGGPDSTALLYCLAGLRDSMNLSLHLAHLNHDFRGEEAEEDARFAAELARKLGLPYTVDEADPIAYQKEHKLSSFEEAAPGGPVRLFDCRGSESRHLGHCSGSYCGRPSRRLFSCTSFAAPACRGSWECRR